MQWPRAATERLRDTDPAARPGTFGLSAPSAISVTLATFDPATLSCAGVGIPGLLVVIPSPDLQPRGFIVNPDHPDRSLDPRFFRLIWPVGYVERVEDGAAEVLDAGGRVVASNGTVLTEPDQCFGGPKATDMYVFDPAPPTPREPYDPSARPVHDASVAFPGDRDRARGRTRGP